MQLLDLTLSAGLGIMANASVKGPGRLLNKLLLPGVDLIRMNFVAHRKVRHRRLLPQRLSVGFVTAAAVVHELLEARDEKRLLRLQRQLAGYKLLIIDELGYVPLSPTGAELLFEVFSQRYERGATIVTSNLPFDEWTGVFGSERLTGALLDRLTHHVHILEMNGDSYRLKQSKKRQSRGSTTTQPANSTDA